MRILSENSILCSEQHAGANIRKRSRIFSLLGRTASIGTGLFLGIMVTMHGIRASRQPASVVSETAVVAASPAGHSNRATRRVSNQKPANWHEIGLASWYGREFQGKETADGELFNMNDLTCAHRSLPLGTWVKVTNLHTHKWIVARVNDRGPVPDTRITDLSSAAAHMLGMRDRGVTRVRLDVIDSRQAVEIAHLEKIRIARLAAQAESLDSGD